MFNVPLVSLTAFPYVIWQERVAMLQNEFDRLAQEQDDLLVLLAEQDATKKQLKVC